MEFNWGLPTKTSAEWTPSWVKSTKGLATSPKLSLELPRANRKFGPSLSVGYSSGQRGRTVNPPANAFDGSNPSPTNLSVAKRQEIASLRRRDSD